MDKVLVLLSTYNGEKYLQEQLDSLYNQTVKVDILVRDDGSKDSTRQILENNKDKIKYYFEDNIGCCHSFLNLIKNASDEYDYYMLCDQDDFWLPNKVEKALELTKKNNSEDKTVLYFSALNTVDEKLNIITKDQQTFIGDIKKLTLPRSLMKSYGYGCTMMFNKFLKQKYAMLDYPFMDSHDWHMQKIALMYGEIVYDSGAYIYYRQHGNNVVGYNPKMKFKKKFNNSKNSRSRVAKDLLNTYTDIEESVKKELTIVANSRKFKNRFKIAFSRKYKMFSFKLDIYRVFFSLFGLI